MKVKRVEKKEFKKMVLLILIFLEGYPLWV